MYSLGVKGFAGEANGICWSDYKDLPTELDIFCKESRPLVGVSPKWKMKIWGNISKSQSLILEQVHINVDSPFNYDKVPKVGG